MKILVTGSSGFIGQHLVEALLARGDEVFEFDIRQGNNSCDIRKPIFSPQGQDIDAIVHLAALTGVRASLEDPASYFRTNVEGSSNVLEFAKAIKAKHVILASTSSVYGDHKGPFTEDMAPRPLSPYAASKVGMEAVAYDWHRRNETPVDVLRFFTVYGPRGRRDMLIGKAVDAIKAGEAIRIHGDGSDLRDWTYVGETVRGIVAAIDSGGKGFQVTNLGGGKPVSVKKTLEILTRVSGERLSFEHGDVAEGDVPVTHADCTLAERRFGWNSTVDLEEGLTLTWEYEK